MKRKTVNNRKKKKNGFLFSAKDRFLVAGVGIALLAIALVRVSSAAVGLPPTWKPVLTYDTASQFSANVSYSNMPEGTYLRFVNANSGVKNKILPTAISGSGKYNAPIRDLQTGLYYLMAQAKDETYLAQTANFYVVSTTNPPTLNYNSQTSTDVYGYYTNMPEAAYIRYVNATSGVKYSIIPTPLISGNGKYDAPIGNLQNGQYYIIAQSKDGTYLTQSPNFYIKR